MSGSGARRGKVLMRHGAGGPAMRGLVESLFARDASDDDPDRIGLGAFDDGAALRIGDRWLVFTTDSHVVTPIFFPGGDLGRLAVCGTVNDLAMMGATQVLGLSLSVLVEEGTDQEVLVRLQDSIAAACGEAGTVILTGDTKVMGRGELDGVVFNTAGIGWADEPVRDRDLRAGDHVVVTGTIGDHGMAVMALRHQLELSARLASDVAPLGDLVARVLEVAGGAIGGMKDPTRGGVASALHEMAAKSGVGIVLRESELPIRPEVASAAELLGVDPLQVANEGKALIAVRPERSEALLEVLRSHPLGKDARVIGECVAERPGSVVLDTGFGRRIVGEVEGELLPRIC